MSFARWLVYSVFAAFTSYLVYCVIGGMLFGVYETFPATAEVTQDMERGAKARCMRQATILSVDLDAHASAWRLGGMDGLIDESSHARFHAWIESTYTPKLELLRTHCLGDAEIRVSLEQLENKKAQYDQVMNVWPKKTKAS